MAASKAIAGTAYLTIDGKQFTLGGKCTVKPADVVREGKTGLSGVAGYKESPKIPSIDIELFVDQDTSMLDMNKITDATVTVELVDGRAYVLRNAWQSGDLEHDVAEGTATVTFEGKKMEPMNAAS